MYRGKINSTVVLFKAVREGVVLRPLETTVREKEKSS